MAEEELIWSQRHSHELNSTSYGHFGTPNYDEKSRVWTFSRYAPTSESNDDNASSHGANTGTRFLKSIPNLRTITETDDDASPDNGYVSSTFFEAHPDLTSFITDIKVDERDNSVRKSVTRLGPLIAWGSAVWLGLEGVDSGNLNVPISARVTGPARNTLCLTCISREQADFVDGVGITHTVRVPSLAGKSHTYWHTQDAILQLSFTSEDTKGRADSFLCVRCATSTSILEPLLRRDSSTRSSVSNRSSLEPNPLVTIDSSITGGASHAHAALNPQNPRRLAIIDEEGNWSIWKISGRRSHTARILYQARLKSSGKIFSWRYKKRPDKIGLYFDGWHKVVWMSSEGQDIDRLLVCNRQSIRLFNLDGEELCSIDPRMDVKKVHSYILDVRPGPKANLCLILTTFKVLLYDIAQTDWKDVGANRGPALLFAFPHHHNPADLSLQATDFFIGGQLFLGLYTSKSQYLHMRQLDLSSVDRDFSVVASDPWSVVLPTDFRKSPVASIVLALSEAAYGGEAFRLVQIVVQYDDLTVSTTIVADGLPDRPKDSDNGRCLLRLPPSRNLGYKSQRHVENADEEDDMTDFIVSDNEDAEPPFDCILSTTLHFARMPVTKMKQMKHVEKITEELQLRHADSRQQSISVQQARDLLSERTRDTTKPSGVVRRGATIADVLENDIRIEDIENDSRALEQMIDQITSSPSSTSLSVCFMDTTKSMLDVYEKMFETFTASLPHDTPDRYRVQKERQVRKIASEQFGSGIFVTPIFAEPIERTEQSPVVVGSSQTVVDDSLDTSAATRSSQEMLSSQTQNPVTESAEAVDAQALNLLESARTRISSLSNITSMSSRISDHDMSNANHFTSILAHLPVSSDATPDNYDYEAMIRSITEAEASTGDGESHASKRNQRRADRAKKLKQHGQSTTEFSQIEYAQQIRSKQSSRALQHGRQKTQTLPIRSNGRDFPVLSSARETGQTSPGHHLSDGHLPEPSSSHATTREPFTSTQPERGAFANRMGVKSEGKVSKKKKRVAGF